MLETVNRWLDKARRTLLPHGPRNSHRGRVWCGGGAEHEHDETEDVAIERLKITLQPGRDDDRPVRPNDRSGMLNISRDSDDCSSSGSSDDDDYGQDQASEGIRRSFSKVTRMPRVAGDESDDD